MEGCPFTKAQDTRHETQGTRFRNPVTLNRHPYLVTLIRHLKKKKAAWTVYMLRCADGTLYTGVSRDVVRRVKEHNSKKLAARYTRARRPVVLVYQEQARTRSAACKREWRIKQLTRSEKQALVAKAKGGRRKSEGISGDRRVLPLPVTRHPSLRRRSKAS